MSTIETKGQAIREYMGNQWPAGPWDSEPDRVQWTDEATGLVCLARRESKGRGFWCGYVAVTRDHMLFGKGYNDVDYDKVSAHGGLTYSDECSGSPTEGICHLTDDGDHAWWFGFDCAHAWDRSPGDEAMALSRPEFRRGADEVYRTLDFVKTECRKLATQLAEYAP